MISFCATCYLLLIFVVYKILDRLVRIPYIGKYDTRYILVTGCDTGFGNRLAKRLDKLGCHVFAACLTQGGVEELKRECSSNLVPVLLNVADPVSVRKAHEVVKSHLPEGRGLWGVVNNAGIVGATGAPEWLTMDDYRAVNNVNLYGLVDVTMTFLSLVKIERGRVVNTASIFGRHSVAAGIPYSISKYGVEAFTDGLRRSMRYFDVKGILIEPGLFRTNISSQKNTVAQAEKSWNQASQEARDEYGEEFYKHMCEKGLGKFEEMGSYKIDDIVDAYEHALLGCYPRARYLVGFDANYIWWPIQMLPEWLGDFILSKSVPNQPLPAAVIKRNKKTQ